MTYLTPQDLYHTYKNTHQHINHTPITYRAGQNVYVHTPNGRHMSESTRPNPVSRPRVLRCAIIRRRRHDVRVHALYDHPSARHGERAVRIFMFAYIAPRKPRGTRVTRRCPASPPMTLAIGIMTHGSCASHPSSSRAHRIARRADSRTHALTITHGFSTHRSTKTVRRNAVVVRAEGEVRFARSRARGFDRILGGNDQS